MGTDEHVCPACRQPVSTVVRRHKTLGAFVPVWGPGPCHNPECEAYVGEPGAGVGARSGGGAKAGGGGGAGSRSVPGTGAEPGRDTRDTGEPREHPGESVAEK
ncbi:MULTISPECIES: hypothetical protein [Streptomyces]|uniref:Uncharacterized protein n=1 Tax=Streptomyces mirabilis TaxID=68239 RepID=A0ABU3UL64_9ACTN|nr:MULTISPECIES: hypothetical protein [Streptomyces]MDU8994611.1 hypothetical protein [Streptomyces mirabilis]QDN90072.1 hypothetical protein FNV61_34925 [Streptomyces sp. RLB3-6]QDO00695.1 hypothetical protein FNV58_36215 [Streptomyces sp. RLB1-9]QDO10917.1 hypothetical protein FNV68_36090 [Streptomyces sp. S1D4-23]QDO22425.1 hypothetical protein FNV65_34790 [Streptomyces sp. S1A1-8]